MGEAEYSNEAIDIFIDIVKIMIYIGK